MGMNYVPGHLDVPREALECPQPGGRVLFLPGSPDRAERIAERFEDRREFPSARGHDVFTGVLVNGDEPVHVGCVSTGMGCPSAGIVVTELVGLGVRRLIRIGSAGGLQPEIRVGDVVIATGGVRDESASNAFAPLEFPAVASWRMLVALEAAGRALLDRAQIHLGVVHSKDSLHGREFGAGPLAEENERYMATLRALGCAATEMEASHLFVLAHALADQAGEAPPGEAPIEAGCVLAILGGVAGASNRGQRDLAEARAIDVAMEAARRLTATVSPGLRQ